MNWKRIICKLKGKHKPETLFFKNAIGQTEKITRCDRCKKVISKNEFDGGIAFLVYTKINDIDFYPENYADGSITIKSSYTDFLQQKYNEAIRTEKYVFAAEIVKSAKQKGIELQTKANS
ncbi:MAG: hypothetical protein ACOCVA_00945 [Prolixibacteraceae bacterium]